MIWRNLPALGELAAIPGLFGRKEMAAGVDVVKFG